MRSPGSSLWLVYTASFPSRLMGSTCRYQTPLRVISGPWIAHVGFSALPPRAGAGSSIPRPVRRNGFAFARLAAMRPRNARRPHSDNYLSYGGELNEGTAGWSARGICKLYSELSLASAKALSSWAFRKFVQIEGCASPRVGWVAIALHEIRGSASRLSWGV
jgi:hypothetical protein